MLVVLVVKCMAPLVLTLNCEGEKSEYVTYNLEYMLSDVTN